MARKAAKKPKKALKARKAAKRTPKRTVLTPAEVRLPVGFTEHLTAALSTAVCDAVARATAQQPAFKVEVPKIELPPVELQPLKEPVRLAHVGADQRYTKNLGNYESFVYGFSLSIPVPVSHEDNIETPEMRGKLRPKYEAVMDFLNGMLKEVGSEIDTARGLAKV